MTKIRLNRKYSPAKVPSAMFSNISPFSDFSGNLIAVVIPCQIQTLVSNIIAASTYLSWKKVSILITSIKLCTSNHFDHQVRMALSKSWIQIQYTLKVFT